MKFENFPMWNSVEVDIHSFCNRNCEFCPRYYNRSGIYKDKNGNKIRKEMPTKKVYDILDQLGELGFEGEIKFHRLSEALLDSRYICFVKYAKRKGMTICNHTNGDILKKKLGMCSKLDGLIDKLVIGLYDYKTYGEKIKQINFWKKKFNNTEICFTVPWERTMIRQNMKLYPIKRKCKKILDQPCFRPSQQLLIRYDGNISICCEDNDCVFNIGNVFKQSIKDIWWSEKHIKLIKELQKPKSKHKFDLCCRCYYSPMKESRTKWVLNELKSFLWKKEFIKLSSNNILQQIIDSIS